MNGPAHTYDWPSLMVDEWTATRDTLHMWTQIVGKIRMVHMPLINHWWQVTLYVSPRGLTTGAVPCRDAVFDVEFDFVNQVLAIRKSDGRQEAVPLAAKPVAEFYGETLSALDRLDIETRIVDKPNEVDPAIPFAEDYQHAEYDPDAARTLPLKVVATPVPALLMATTATLKLLPDTLVRITPVVAVAAVVVSKALKRAGGVEPEGVHNDGIAAPLLLTTQLVVHALAAPQHTPPLARSAHSSVMADELLLRRHCEAWVLPRRRIAPPDVTAPPSDVA